MYIYIYVYYFLGGIEIDFAKYYADDTTPCTCNFQMEIVLETLEKNVETLFSSSITTFSRQILESVTLRQAIQKKW